MKPKPMQAHVYVRLHGSEVMNEIGTAEIPITASHPQPTTPGEAQSVVTIELGALAALLRAVADRVDAREHSPRDTALDAVEAQYAATHARLADDPEYQALATAADQEANDTPDLYLARNRFAIYIEINTPLRDR